MTNRRIRKKKLRRAMKAQMSLPLMWEMCLYKYDQLHKMVNEAVMNNIVRPLLLEKGWTPQQIAQHAPGIVFEGGEE